MDFFNFDIDYSTYLDLTSPPLRGAVAGGLLHWALGGGAQLFSVDWKDGVNSVLVRTVTAVALGFPVQFLIDTAGIQILQNNRMIVTGAAVFFLIPFFSWAEKGVKVVTGKLLNMLPF